MKSAKSGLHTERGARATRIPYADACPAVVHLARGAGAPLRHGIVVMPMPMPLLKQLANWQPVKDMQLA